MCRDFLNARVYAKQQIIFTWPNFEPDVFWTTEFIFDFILENEFGYVLDV